MSGLKSQTNDGKLEKQACTYIFFYIQSYIYIYIYKKDTPIPYCIPFLIESRSLAKMGKTKFNSNLAIGWLYNIPNP